MLSWFLVRVTVYQWPCIRWLFLLLLLLILRLSSLNWVSSRRVSILPPYHHRHRLRTLLFPCCKTQSIGILCASGHHPLSELQYLGCTWSMIGSYGCLYLYLYLVPGVSHVKKCDWLVKNMTDWRLEVDLGQLNDWRRLAVSMTGGGDFAPSLLFVTVSPMQCMTSSVVLQLLLYVMNTLFRANA